MTIRKADEAATPRYLFAASAFDDRPPAGDRGLSFDALQRSAAHDAHHTGEPRVSPDQRV
jgi:hypothetical protein